MRVARSIDLPRGTPPGITPPGSTPPANNPPDEGTSERSTPPLADAHRDYRGELSVFPGAEGFGSTTRAGRGGQVLRVTNLADSGPGSFRAAVTASGPRTVVFEVGGIIRLKSQIRVREPFLTIAGQTAPSPGITLAGDVLRFETHDVLMQHMRIRVGAGTSSTSTPPKVRDGLGVRTNDRGEPHTYNIYIDHCSISWAFDENVSLWYSNVYDITIRNSIISEAIAYNRDKMISFGMIVGYGQRRVSVLRNLFAHNGDRNPKFTKDNSGLVVNNVIYNVGNAAITTGAPPPAAPTLLSVVGNVYIPGQDSRRSRQMVLAQNGHRDSRLFVDDNIGPFGNEDPWSVVDNRVGRHIRADARPVDVAPLTVLPAVRAYGHVLASAGARPRDRDAVDRRVVNDVRRGTGRLLERPSQVAALPSARATHRPLRPPSSLTADTDGDGYTDVEEWLHCMAAEVESGSRSLQCAR
ncbi:MAG: pectate lyase family protein [Thermoanaerobaculia bacterium]